MAAGNHRSLGRDPELARALKGILATREGIADTLRRRDTLNVQRSLSESASAAATTDATVADLQARLARLEALLEYLSDPSQILLCWAKIQTDSVGGASLIDAHGISSVAVLSPRLRVFFDPAMTNTSYISGGHCMVNAARWVYTGGESLTQCDVTVATVLAGAAASNVDAATVSMDLAVFFFGRM